MKAKISKYLVILILSFLTYSCADLEVQNLNEPDAATALGSVDDVVSLAGGTYRTWWMSIHDNVGPGAMWATMADQHTCSWGNFGMRFMSSEPRSGWNNNVTYEDANTILDFWNESYSAISSVNDVLNRLYDPDKPLSLDTQAETDMVEAWCLFVSGVIHGYIALSFDRGIIINWDTDVNNLEYTDYHSVQTAGLGFLQESIDIASNTDDYTLPDGWLIGEIVTKESFLQLVHSYYARILAYMPRNATDNDAVDWALVKTHASEGISGWDHAPVMDNNSWWNDLAWVISYPGWARVDHRIINLMDEDYPSRWPDNNFATSGGVYGPASSPDARLESDFQYMATQDFNPTRGFYHFSHYRHSRYDQYLSTWDVATPTFLEWENDMLLAEAEARTDNVAAAVTILNHIDGARKTRGLLSDVASSDRTKVLELIFYEKDIELIASQAGIAYFDMRRRDMLQRGTPLHFPIPGGELELTLSDWYTISGSPDGINISDGHWVGKDGLVSPPN